MPKLLVLFQSRDADVVALAAAVAEGARRVRFAEVDLRQLATPHDAANDAILDAEGRVLRRLEHADDLTAYDGVVLAVGDELDAAALGEAMARAGGSLGNRVGAAVTTTAGAKRRAVLWAAMTPMADRGMILAPAPFDVAGEPAVDSARGLGRRVAEVVGWVTHARSHHHHDHHHDHQDSERQPPHRH
jgi:NAD(P)H dehydrogenase (quinone)